LIDLAVSVSTGVPWLGFETRAGKVLYVNLELQTAFYRARLEDVFRAKGVELDERLEIWNLRGFVADYQALIPRIRDRIRNEGHALVIVDPIYKILGHADENSATDITALVNALESIAVVTGAAVAMAGHFAKGNAAAKESIDRISGSGVFARDPDSLITFTRHEEDRAFTLDMTLRNLPPTEPFVVRWQHPLFGRDTALDPAKLKQAGGRPSKNEPEDLLECLGDNRLTTTEWQEAAEKNLKIPETRFYQLRKKLEKCQQVIKSVIDDKWEQIRPSSRSPVCD
jgi:hypothetical protein